jgi:pyrroloquinoline-quinone synthase
MNVHAPTEPMSPDALEEALRAIGPVRYHDLHPFHGLLHDGKLSKGQVQAWALNRFVYQSAIPRKDASLIARCEDRELRREWVHRINDHDGSGDDKGGIERWLILTEGLGLDRDYVISQEGALPATKFAVEAYVRFVRERPLVEAVASSLTELFAPSLHKRRIAGMLANYSFIDEKVVAYFRRRLDQATPAPSKSNAAPLRLCGSRPMYCGRSSTRCTTPMSTAQSLQGPSGRIEGDGRVQGDPCSVAAPSPQGRKAQTR